MAEASGGWYDKSFRMEICRKHRYIRIRFIAEDTETVPWLRPTDAILITEACVTMPLARLTWTAMVDEA